MAPSLYLPVLDPRLYLPTLAYIFITSPGPEFAYTNLYLLILYLHLRPWPTICITGLESEFAFTLLVVAGIVVGVISLEQIMSIFICRF